MNVKPMHAASSAEHLWGEWRRCRDWLKPAIERNNGVFDENDVLRGIIRNEFQFWPGDGAAIVTEIVKYPKLKALRVVLAGGDLAEIERRQPEFEAWARDRGCARIELHGRDGWARALAGYRKLYTVIGKDLTP